jgi:hypothetical protein
MQEKPPSVLRPSGSSSCLCRKPGDYETRTNKITMIQTEDLPKFSKERYYMLSEIQLKAHSILFLQDLVEEAADDETQDLSVSSASEKLDCESHDHSIENINGDQVSCNLPPCIILYLLWKVNDSDHNSVEHFTRHVKKVMEQLKYVRTHHTQNTQSSSPIYLVIDRIATFKPIDQSTEDFREEQIKIAESTVRTITSSDELRLRDAFEGIVVGISDDYRAAPGLELCCDAILIGDAERRHYPRKRKQETTFVCNRGEVDPSKSSIGIVTEYAEDLIGIEPDFETDAAQDISLHARTCGNWGDKGNILDFGFRAHKYWRKTWNFADVVEKQHLGFDFWKIKNCHDLDTMDSGYSIMGKRRRRGIKEQARFLASDAIKNDVDQRTNIMVAFLLVILSLKYYSSFQQLLLDCKTWWDSQFLTP